jgi:hypothetical protein
MREGLFRRLLLVTAASLAAVLGVGVVAAAAHGGPGGGDPGGGPGRGANVSSLVTAAATQLGVTRAKLVGAIQDAAGARVDAAVADGDVTADEATNLKADAQDNLSTAYGLSQTATVASKLGVTTTALNTGFRAAREALATAQIDKALAAGTITADEATAAKTKLAAATLPGYKGGLGFGLGLGGPRH